RWTRRQNRLAFRSARQSSADQAVAGRFFGCRRLKAVRRDVLLRNRALDARAPYTRHARREMAQSGLHGLRLYALCQRRDRPAHPRRRRRPDRLVVQDFSIPRAAQPRKGSRSMIDVSEISAPTDWPAPDPLTLTDGGIAVLNLQAQIDGLEGHSTTAEAGTLIDLLILRGQILGCISDYERAAELANRQVGAALKDPAAYVARARTRAVFHRFTDALDDLDDADRMSPHDAAAKRERAAILQAQGRFDVALSTYSAVIDSVGQFERAAALASLWAERGEADRAQRFYLDGLRSYRGISPFPVALLEFQLGVMWMRRQRLEEARTCFEAAIARVPAYAGAQGHLAEVEADLGNPEAALTRLYPLAVSSD